MRLDTRATGAANPPKPQHWVQGVDFKGGRLEVQLPSQLDSFNARLLRKMVLHRLAECRELVLDAAKVDRLGNVGAASLWQVMSIAGRQGVWVALLNITPAIHASLLMIRRSELAKETGSASIEDDLQIVITRESQKDERTNLRLRRASQNDNRVQKDTTIRPRQKRRNAILSITQRLRATAKIRKAA